MFGVSSLGFRAVGLGTREPCLSRLGIARARARVQEFLGLLDLKALGLWGSA